MHLQYFISVISDRCFARWTNWSLGQLYKWLGWNKCQWCSENGNSIFPWLIKTCVRSIVSTRSFKPFHCLFEGSRFIRPAHISVFRKGLLLKTSQISQILPHFWSLASKLIKYLLFYFPQFFIYHSPSFYSISLFTSWFEPQPFRAVPLHPC